MGNILFQISTGHHVFEGTRRSNALLQLKRKQVPVLPLELPHDPSFLALRAAIEIWYVFR